MQLIPYDSKLLKTKCVEFDFSNPPFDPIEHAKELVHFMYEKEGLGLTDNQIGGNRAVFAMRGQPNFVCYNPRIVDVSDEVILLDEGCLSYPNLIVKIERPKRIKVRFQTPNGETLTKIFDGMSSRIFQHEMMHINGKPFCKDASRLRLTNAIKKAKKKYNTRYLIGNIINDH